jgi:hypothetical protein
VRHALKQFLRGKAEEQIVFRADGIGDEARALIDIATPRQRFLRADSLDRLRQVRLLAVQTNELGERLQSSDADRSARQLQVAELTAVLQESEADRSARLRQVNELTALLQESEADRSARGKLLAEAGVRFEALERDLETQKKHLHALTLPAPAPIVTPGSPAGLDDLRVRLQGAHEQARTARGAAHQLSRQLALMHRLVKFFFDGPSPPRVARTGEMQGQPAVLLTDKVIYHLEVCQNQGAHTAISGWAFRPARGWDATATSVTLLFRAGYATYTAPTRRVSRPDMAAYFAAQPPEVAGGATGLAGMGFAGEVLNRSLPAGVEWKITLRLECAGKMCEHATTERVRL